MKIKAIRCPQCKDVIYSRARHDCRRCGCGFVTIDGGFDYWKVSMKTPLHSAWEDVDTPELDLDVTREELYRDWNEGIDKYGIVREKKGVSKECGDFMDGFP